MKLCLATLKNTIFSDYKELFSVLVSCTVVCMCTSSDNKFLRSKHISIVLRVRVTVTSAKNHAARATKEKRKEIIVFYSHHVLLKIDVKSQLLLQHYTK